MRVRLSGQNKGGPDLHQGCMNSLCPIYPTLTRQHHDVPDSLSINTVLLFSSPQNVYDFPLYSACMNGSWVSLGEN
jgi:hypothetical protein